MNALIELIKEFVEGNNVHLVIATVAILVVTAIVSSLFTRLIRHLMCNDRIDMPQSSILVNVERIIVWGIGISLVMSACFGLDVTALVAALGIGGIAISLGLQDTMKNFLGGMQVTALGIAKPGDRISIGSTTGVVEDVSWRQTVVRDIDGNVHIIPNAIMNSTEVTQAGRPGIVVVPFAVNTDCADLNDVAEKMIEAATPAIREVAVFEREPWVLFYDVNEYAARGKMRFVITDPTKARAATDRAVRALAPFARSDV